jgi:hypothetical protein
MIGLAGGAAKSLHTAEAAVERGRRAGRLGRFKPPDFRLECETQLRRLVFRQPVRHLRKDGAPIERAARVPWKALRLGRILEFAFLSRTIAAKPSMNGIAGAATWRVRLNRRKRRIATESR